MRVEPYTRKEWRRAWKAADKTVRRDAGQAAWNAVAANTPQAALLAAGLAERDYRIFRIAAITGGLAAVVTLIGLLVWLDFSEIRPIIGETGAGLVTAAGVEFVLLRRAARARRTMNVNMEAADASSQHQRQDESPLYN